MSSASTEACEKKQKKSSRFGIIAIAKRRSSKKRAEPVSPSPSSKSEASSLSESGVDCTDYTEIRLQRTSPQSLNAKLMAAEAQVADLSAQLGEARAEIEALQNVNKEDKATISQLETTVKLLQVDTRKLEKKVTEYESVGKELDDDSFDAAHEFQLKKEIGQLKEDLGKVQGIKDELAETKVELQVGPYNITVTYIHVHAFLFYETVCTKQRTQKIALLIMCAL